MVSVAVLAGGPSVEHDVSLQTGAEILAHLRNSSHPVRPILISRDNAWSLGDETQDFAGLGGSTETDPAHAIEALRASGEVAFIGLHGRYGEDGQLQRLLEEHGIRFTGSGSHASAIGMDKDLSKLAAAKLGAHCATHEIVEAGQVPVQRLLRIVGLPCVVKPVRGGSSVGVARVERAEDLAAAVDRAVTEDDCSQAMVEAWMSGTEVTCAVLRVRGAIRRLPLVAIHPAGDRFYDYHAKYIAKDTVLECPARIPAATEHEIGRVSEALYSSLELRGMVRMDFIVRKESGLPVFLELNTLPGFTGHSLVPRAAEVAGLSRRDVLEAVLVEAEAVS
ncbi:MAG: D-alanine--D-alanine ligase family protein [Planctomycetota bacterium]